MDVRKKHQSAVSLCALNGDRTHNLSMCPDWELDPQPCGAWNDTPTNRDTQPELDKIF